jgi:hypothetical protein
MTTLDHFVPMENITRAAQKIADLDPCPFAGRLTPDQIIAALGEFGDIWPDNIRPDLIRCAVEDAARRYS